MALSKSALKEKFVTGAIPTQTDFANLIDGMLSMPLGGGTGDTTIGFGNGDSTDRLYVKSLRYICDSFRSYFLIGAWDDELKGNYLVAVICFPDNAINGYDFNITYHLLDKTERSFFESNCGDINTADEIELVRVINGANWQWFKITQPSDNPPVSRVLTYSSGSEYTTWHVYPAIFNNQWVIGYALECTIEGGAGSTYQYLTVQGNNIVEFNHPDTVIVDKLRNGIWNKKLL